MAASYHHADADLSTASPSLSRQATLCVNDPVYDPGAWVDSVYSCGSRPLTSVLKVGFEIYQPGRQLISRLIDYLEVTYI
jgi:hypothetical protein